MEQSERISRIVAPSIQAMGYEIVRVRLSGGAGRAILQIMVERGDGAVMTVDDCAEVSRAVSAVLDVEDPMQGEYTLEISSPGIDRPLTRLKDFERFAGFEARIETRVPVEGRKRFRGVLKGVEEDDCVRVDTPEGPVAIPFDAVVRARLVLTDELIAASGGAG